MPGRWQVHLVEDDSAVRDSLSFSLSAAGWAVSAYASAEALISVLPLPAGACIVTDVRLGGISGLELIRVLRAQAEAYPIIVMTGHADVPMAIEAMKAGIVEFLEKPFDDQALLAVLAGIAASAEGSDGGRQAAMDRLSALSIRERQVLACLVQGKPNKIIAYELGISIRTVEVHRANVMRRAHVRSLPALVQLWMIAHGHGDPDEGRSA